MSINFQIGVYVQQELWVTWPNFWKSRSKVKVTRAHNVYSKLSTGWSY